MSSDSLAVLAAFVCYLIGVAALGILSHRFLTRGSFVKEYFVGNRGLGPWVLALSVAATAISGGTFMGFPSLIYTNGWIMAIWIASYMAVPLTTMALLGKRINQVARVSGSVTVPDVLRDRFGSPALGIVATLLILVLLTVNLVAQFKGGATVMQVALDLPPARATFEGAAPDAAGKNLVLTFKLADGSPATQKTPLPVEKATYRKDKWRYEPAPPATPEYVIVHFEAAGKEYPRKVRFPPDNVSVLGMNVDKGYLIGLLIFAFTVVGYTTYGGFWAVTWTDVLEGIVMLVGVVILAILAVRAVTPERVELRPPAGTVAKGPVREDLTGLARATERLRQEDPHLVYGPGPKDYLPLGMAFSFFLMWALMSPGQPSGMVRLMSFKDAPSVRRALMMVCGYYIVTYFSLLIIFVCARAMFPTEYLNEIGSEGQPDRIMPEMIRKLADPIWAGLLLAAPYAAIMSTVAAFLLMISSSLVRDVYQRSINPKVSDRTVKILSYVGTALVGVLVTVLALNPPGFLQYIIVFTGTGLGCSFLIPMGLSLYWRRATRQGILAGMLGGFLTVVMLYALGWTDSKTQGHIREYETARRVNPQSAPERPELSYQIRDSMKWLSGWGEERHDPFNPLFLGGVDAIVWGLLVSLVFSVGVSLATRPDEALVAKYFP